MKDSLKGRKKQLTISVLLGITALLCLVVILKVFVKDKLQRQDYEQISSTQYDTVFLSMYPIDTYQEEDYSYYRGMTLFKAAYCIPSLSVLSDYLQQIADSGNQVTTAYLGIRPELTDPVKLQKLLDANPGIQYEIVLPYPSADYWQSLSGKDYEKTLTAFCNLLTAAPDIPEANFYFFGTQKWLIANPGHYLDDWSVTEDTATILMAHSDTGHGFLITAENASSDKQLCFVVNYGLNDYFSEFPVASEDPYDTATYSGAVRTAVKQIRENAPEAQIILCTPNFSAIFENGTEPHGTEGAVLEDYANAILALSKELQTGVLDNYHDLGITPENHEQYLLDQVHPNYACRFLIGSNLCYVIQ